MEYRNGKTYVLFTILPLPSVVGDAPGAKLENDLDTAANLIVSTVASSKMIIIVHLEGIYQSVEVRCFVGTCSLTSGAGWCDFA